MSNSNASTQTRIDAKGVLRWITNNACVPMDCLDAYAPMGYDRAMHKAAIDADTAAFIAAYQSKPRVRSSEELCEIRANLGGNAIDLITGKRIFA